VAVQDREGASPYMIAAIRGHNKLAKVICEIALVQYEPKDKSNLIKWRLPGPEDSDYDSSVTDDDDGPRLCSDLIDENFTYDNLGAISNEVKSSVKPIDMLGWQCSKSAIRNIKTGQFKEDKERYGTFQRVLTIFKCIPPSSRMRPLVADLDSNV
jgi:hypothetical protein